MTEQRIIEFVDKMVVADQTELVWLLLGDHGKHWETDWENVIYPKQLVSELYVCEGKEEWAASSWEDECNRILEEIDAWKLINPRYVDIIKGCDMPYLQLEGQTWLGKMNTLNSLTEWQYLKDYIKNLDNE